MMKRFFQHLKRIFENFNPYRWNNPYLKLDSDEELENVHQSPPRTTPLTISEKILLVPQYMTAISIYLDLCLLYYSVMTLGGAPVAIAFAFAFYCEKVTPFTIGCALFIGHLIASAFSLKLFFSNKERVRWLYDLIGEDRIRPKVFMSPAVNGMVWKGGRAAVAIAGGELVTHAGASAVDGISAFQELDRNERMHNRQIEQHTERKQDLYNASLPSCELKETLKRANDLMDKQTKAYHDAQARVTSRPRVKGGIFREVINVELTLETRKANT